MGFQPMEFLESRCLLSLGTIAQQLVVDQFGYRTSAPRKVALLADAVSGQNATITRYNPGPNFQIRRLSDDAVVFTGAPVSWNNGAVQADSGDRVWTCDFSSLGTPGDYYLYDPTNNLRSDAFTLDDNIDDPILTADTRMFYYQRAGTAIPAQYGGNWNHAVGHAQDTVAREYLNGAIVPNSTRDVSGGWYDAGDYNKYVPFTTTVLWNLLTAYEWNPAAFGDDTNIPESGNSVPDILDEVKWETDWLLKMQLPNGSVLNRVSDLTYNSGNADPSTDTQARFYTQATTWATASFAASLAHAARVFSAFQNVYPGYSTTLLNAATNAWNYLSATPSMTPASGQDGGGSGGGTGNLASAAASADSSYDLRLRILASAELFKTTGNTAYKTYFDANYKNPASADSGFQPLTDSTPHFDPSLAVDLNHAYVTYATTPGATTSIVNEIKNAVKNVEQSWLALGQYLSNADPYRAFMWSGHYTWGSNQLKAEWANGLIYAAKLGVNPANTSKYLEAAEEYLHYIDGRNPLDEVYLSNMGTKGANLGALNSPLQFYHSWFADGSAKYDGANSLYGPAPGYLVGGPNQFYDGTASPPKGQPPMKSFVDFNTSGQPSWEITEPAIYYQAAFTLLLSTFATNATPSYLSASKGTTYYFTGPANNEALHVPTGTVTFTATVPSTLALALDVQNSSTVRLSSSETISGLALGTNATLDLGTSNLVINYDNTAATYQQYYNAIAAADHNRWPLTGLTSTAARASATHQTPGPLTTLAITDAASYIARNGANFDGQTLSPTTPAILIKYTYAGDATLDGKVDDSDVDVLYAHYQDSRRQSQYVPFYTNRVFTDADFTFDGRVDDRDADLLADMYDPLAPVL